MPQEDFAPMVFVATEAVEEIQRLGLEGFFQQMSGWDFKVTEEEVRWLEQMMNASHRHSNVEAFGVSHPQPKDSKAHTIPDAKLEKLVGNVLSVPLRLPHAIDEFLRGRKNLFDTFRLPPIVAELAALSDAEKADRWSRELLQMNSLFGSNPQLLGDLTNGLTTIRNAMRTPEFRAAMIPYQQSINRDRIVAENHLHDGWNIVQEKVGARPGDATMLRALMDSAEGLGLYNVPKTRPSFIQETARK